MRDKPWSSVLEWLADQTSLPVSGVYQRSAPSRTSPKTKKMLTIPEVLDVLNEALLAQPPGSQGDHHPSRPVLQHRSAG
jgi:hypothetical protein